MMIVVPTACYSRECAESPGFCSKCSCGCMCVWYVPTPPPPRCTKKPPWLMYHVQNQVCTFESTEGGHHSTTARLQKVFLNKGSS